MAKDVKRALMIAKAEGGPIDTYHGSPHDFDKFDFSKIGTGEGAQVYGHGLYLADQEAVARQYKMPAVMAASPEINGVKNAKANYEYFRNGPRVVDKSTNKIVRIPPQSHEEAIKSVYDDLTETPEKAHIHRHTINALTKFAEKGEWPELGEGRLYDVRLHADPESLLDLDRPMAEQPPRVKKALALRPTNTGIGGGPKLYSESTGLYIPDKPDIARSVVPVRDKGATASMEKAGIPGVRYYDGYSRSKGAGSRNYVVFPTDKDILEITRKRASGGKADAKRALMIARDQRNLLRRIANIYHGPGGGMDPSPGGGGYSGPGGGKYIGPSHYAEGGSVPPFKLHSGAAKIIKSKGQAKATPQQYAAMPGIKPDELKHSKFDTLGSKALPREEVIKHLEDNALPLEETHLGGGSRKATKFHDPKYQLPGGKNYREVLLHTPVEVSPESPEAEKARARADAAGRAYDDALTDQLSGTLRFSDDEYRRASDEYDAANIALSRFEASRKREEAQAGFRKGHWETPNVLAHVRMSDRVGPNGEKILHLEEAQSDWGQKGRKKGFSNPEVANRQRELFQKLNDIKKAHVEAQRDVETKHKINLREFDAAYKDAMGGAESKFNASRMTKSDIDAYNEASDLALTKTQHLLDPAEKIRQEAHKQIHTAFAPKIEALEKEFSALPKHGDIPQGPYVDNTQKWTDLALKRVLHEAAHGGYDKIVVTPGEEQAKRYPEDDEEAKAARERGMKGYYDSILPKRLQALAQQHDPQAKVNLHAHDLSGAPDPAEVKNRAISMAHNTGDIDRPTEAAWNAADPEVRDWHTEHATAEQARADFAEGINHASAPLHSLDVTPQMRDSIKQSGFNSFKRGGDVDVAKKPSTPTIKKTLDLRPAEAFPELATRYPETAPPEWAHDPKKKVDYLAKRLSPEALAVQTAKKVIQKDIEEGRYKPYFDPLKRYDASSPEFGVKTPTTGIKKVKPETQAKYEAHARSPEATTRLSAAFERGMLQPREASDWYLMGQLHNEYVAKHGPKLGSQLFKERFADAMSATTGGADPTSNFLTSHYGNYVKAHKQQFPEKSYDLPFPIGGRYIGGNIDQFDKMIMQGKGVTPANPKRYNFSHNFLGDDSGSTIDEQMSGLYDPKMSVPPEGTYGHYEGALADLAKQTKGAKSPRHFQEVAWAGAKDMGTKGGYRASPMISHINQSIERTSRLTGLSPDEVVAQNLVDVKGPMFKKGGRVGYTPGGGVEHLQQNLHQSFGDLNRQVAAAPQQQQAPAGGDYKAMLEQATQPSLSPDYQAMVNKALEPSGKTYEEMFPANVKPYTPAAPVTTAAAPAAAEQPADANKWMTDYGSWMTSLMGGGGDGLKRGGKVNIVERALAVTRRK